jgi:predicted nucleic acid-binding protein
MVLTNLPYFTKRQRKYNPRGNRVYDIEIVSVMLANGLKKVATANIDDFSNIDEIEVIEIKI